MKRKLIQYIVSLFIVVFLCNASYAKSLYKTRYIKEYQLNDLPRLKQDPIHETVARRVTNYFTQSHYHDFKLDASFSTRIFNRYLKQLDFNKSLFTAADIAQFSPKSTLFANELKTGDLRVAFDIYNASLQKRFKRYQYALTLLNAPMQFNNDDVLDFDRERIAWPKSEKELDEYWKKRVKFDELNLALKGKKEEEIRATLTKRYKQVLKTLVQTNSEDVFQVFMNSFAREIDPHTSYLAPRKKRDFDSDMSLSFEGIGATLNMEEDYTTIVSFVSDGPAEKSRQMNIGDKIIGVGQKNKPMEDVIGWRLDDIVDLIRGPKGTSVRLEILSSGKKVKPRVVELRRDTIRLEDREVKASVKKTARGNVGILEVPSFYIGLTTKTQKLLADFKKQNVDTVVIDLRSNGGGSLAEVISLTGLFIPGGPVVQVRDNLQNVTQYRDKGRHTYYDGPLVVLVNRYSASASEIFSAALQDYARAVIIGEKTFGKGTVQTSRNIAYPIDEKIHPDWPELGGVQYTIQKFYRINGGSTQRKGVQPDIEMTHSQLDFEFGERYMDNALPWDSILPVKYQPIGNTVSILPILKEAHEKRIKKNPEFNYIEEDIKKINDQKETKYKVSLNKAIRLKQQKEEDAIELFRTNERLKRMGLAPIKDMDKLPKGYKVPDAFLDEAVQIALDVKGQYIHR